MNLNEIGANLPIDTFLSILNSLDIQLMVTNPETDEILFANKKMNQGYNVNYNPVGKRCWEVYQNDKRHRCEFCPLSNLMEEPETPIEWDAYNTATGRWFHNISCIIKWTNGQKVHLEQGYDITESRELADTLRNRLKQQELMSSMSQSFISTDDTSDLIYNSLKTTGDFLQADRIMLAKYNPNGKDVTFEYSWYIDEAFSYSSVGTPGVDLSHFIEKYKDRSAITICNDTKNDPLYAPMMINGMASFISIPVYINDVLWGALTIEMCEKARTWLESDILFAKMLCNMISGVMARDEIYAVAREAEERTYTMLNATPLACTFFDENGNLIDCNEEAPRMYGLATKRDYIEGFFKISPEIQPNGVPSKTKAISHIQKTFETGHEVFEWEHLDNNGNSIPTEITLVRVKWRNGYRVAGYSRDLRVLKANMAKIEKTQIELIEAKNRAEESAKAKTNFLSNMSHEIRTPMNAIIGMTDLAKKSDDIERIQYCLNKVDDAANHLLGVINDILDMSKIESGKFELSDSDFMLETMLQVVSNVTNFRAEQKKQDFIIKVDKDVPDAIITDQLRLTQVITNLLSNAVKFTSDGGKISLLVHNVEENNNECTLMFDVIDSGIGISKEQQSKLFQTFSQADGSISRRFGGTGLGLAISKNIVELMGGEIGIESEPKKGSRFYFTIKVKKGTSNYQNTLNENIDWKKVRVLVVDDAPEVLEYFEDIAASVGLFCKTASSGYEACKIIEQEDAYQILFVDWMMPEMNGIELTEKIRKYYNDNVVVIMISAVEWNVIEAEAKRVGVDRFISKPLLPSPIIDCINQCLGQQKQLRKKHEPNMLGQYFLGKRMLLAEDIEINREILQALLSDTGIQIDCAENGRIAYEKFAADPAGYDIILMDIHMPEMDGYEATKKIRALDDPHALNVTIMAMTANVFREDIERCLSVGMDDHIGKPIDTDELLNKLKRYL